MRICLVRAALGFVAVPEPLGNQFLDSSSDEILFSVAEEVVRSLIGPDDAAIFGHDNETVRGGIEQISEREAFW
jgi:hypothetical protein